MKKEYMELLVKIETTLSSKEEKELNENDYSYINSRYYELVDTFFEEYVLGCCCDIDNDYLVKVRELGELLGELYIHKGSYSELTYSSQIFLSGILDDILMMNNEYINDEKEYIMNSKCELSKNEFEELEELTNKYYELAQ